MLTLCRRDGAVEPIGDRLPVSRKAKAALEAFYGARNYAPIWVENGAANARSKAAATYLAGVSADGLEAFVAGLPNRKIPVVESWTYPLWHQWPVFLAAVTCLVGEWALRRWKGLP